MKVFNWMQLPPLLLLMQGVFGSSSPYGKYINTPCTAASDCGLDTHLQCINNFCQCDSFTQIYDQSTQKCLLLLRQQCPSPATTTTSQKHHHNYQHSASIKCVPHADCTKGTCQCKTGYRPSPDFLCKPDYGSPCHVHDDCDDAQGLICTKGLCQCFNSTWQFQGQFGCVDPKNPQYNEMLGLLNQTEYLLKENDLDISDMFNDLGLQNDPETAEYTITNILSNRQFGDTYNTNDLQFAAQNTDSTTSGGGGRFNLQQILGLFNTFRNLIPRPGGGGGGGGRGGFLRNLFRGGGGGGGGGGYPEASTTAAPPEYGPPPAAPGYQASGQPEGQGMGMRMGLLNNFLRLFNQMIPIVRQLRMRFNPVRFFQNIVMRFSRTTTPAPAPAPAAIHNAPPTIISSNGNYQSNPIFESGQAQQASPGGGGGGGGGGRGQFRFFMRTRDRFRNFLRRPNQGGYAPANPPDKYGPPDKGYGPPAAGGDAPPPADDAPPADAPPPDAPPPDAPPPAADAPAGNAPQNYYTNNPRAGFQTQSNQQPQYSTVYATSGGGQQQHQNLHQNQNNFAQSANTGQHHGAQQGFQNNAAAFSSQDTYSAGHQPQAHSANPPSFFQSQHNANNQHHGGGSGDHNNNQQFNNNHIQPQLQHNNNFNAQPTSHHQSTFVPQPSNNQPYIQNSNNINPTHSPHPTTHIFDSNLNTFVTRSASTRIPSVTNSPAPPPIPQFKLQVPQHHHHQNHHHPHKPESNHENLSQNFILSEADDPHPGFTPLSTPAPVPQPSAAENHGLGFRTSPRFERIGQEDQQQPSTAAENWRETF